MIIKRTISKEEIKELPKAVFEGPIHVIQSEKEADKAVAISTSPVRIGH